MGIHPQEYWEMDQVEFQACLEGYEKRVEDQLTQSAVMACWVVNNIPIPFIKSRKTLRPKQLMGQAEEAPTFDSADSFKEYMKQKQSK